MNSKVFFGILILVAGVLAGWYVLGGNPPSLENLMNPGVVNEKATPTSMLGPDTSDQSVDAGKETVTKGGVQARMVVTYTDTGFAPEPVTVKKGTTVTFVNESSRGMWVASGVHPTHQLLPGFDQLSAANKGGTYEYVFLKVGTWRYHNHVQVTDGGSIVVTE